MKKILLESPLWAICSVVFFFTFLLVSFLIAILNMMIGLTTISLGGLICLSLLVSLCVSLTFVIILYTYRKHLVFCEMAKDFEEKVAKASTLKEMSLLAENEWKALMDMTMPINHEKIIMTKLIGIYNTKLETMKAIKSLTGKTQI